MKRWIGWDCGGGEWSQANYDEKYRSGWRPEYRYTRSRDALKAIRPAGWCLEVACSDIFVATIENWDDALWQDTHPFTLHAQEATEELAELHVIIQAIAFERGRTDIDKTSTQHHTNTVVTS